MSREKCIESGVENTMRGYVESAKTKTSRIVLYRRVHQRAWTPRRGFAAVALLAIAMLAGCHKKTKPHVAMVPRIGATESGVASWYGYPYHGRRAANGEVYDMEKLTAAHRTLPFDTWVEVMNVANAKTVTVRITDRGPFVDGRIVDLSKAAARSIDLIGPGIARVQLTIVSPPPDAEMPAVSLFAVQTGAYRDRERAERMRQQYEQEFGTARLVNRSGEPPLW